MSAALEDPSKLARRCRSDPHPGARGDRSGAPACSREMDRSIYRFLCLPIFDEGFRSVLVELNLDKIEMWLALSDSSHGTADHKLSEILPALTKKQEVADKILQRLDMVNILASIISRSTEKIQQEIATDLGYGSAEPPRAGVKRSSADAPIAAPAPKALGAKPAGLGPVEEVTSLQSVELSERRKWGARLSAISTKAGAAAGINDQSRCTGLMPEEAARLKTMSFEAGGFRTIRQNVRYWEKFDEWAAAHGLRVYLPTIVAVMRYSLYLKDQGCGPSILPAFKYAVGWVCKRLVMPLPNLADPQLKAVIDEVYSLRGKELKEAVPVPSKLVMALEIYLDFLINAKKDAAAIFIRWTLILIFSSLRFDDGVHVAPTSLQLTEDALLGLVWQTKVERKKRGTRFAVPVCSISGRDWLEKGWKLFQPYMSDRDFFIWELQDEKKFAPAPVTYSRSLAWLKHFLLLALGECVRNDKIALNEVPDLEQAVQAITWHSMRVTMLAEAVKANVDDKIAGLQANWKDPSQLVLKYARQRKELSVAMVKDMASKLRDQWVPDPDLFAVEEEDAEVTEPIVQEFIVKSSIPERALLSSDFRCHIFDRKVFEDKSICGKLRMQDAVSVGSQAPGMICQLCQNKAGF